MADSVPEAGDQRVGRLRSLLGQMRYRDHTRGSLTKSVVFLALPSIITSTFGFSLFQVVDLRFMSLLGVAEVAAAGATNQTFRQGLLLAVLGLSVATQMMISRLVGEGRIEGAEHVAGQTFLVGVGVALLAALAGIFLPHLLASLIARDPEVIALGAVYLRIGFLTFGLLVSNQIFSAVLNGAGDATTPMIINFVVTPFAILGEWVLAFGNLGFPALGIAGMALGSAVGGLMGMSVALFALFSGRCRVHLRLRHLVPDWTAIVRLLAFSWQPALHMVARSLMVIFFMWLAGRLGGNVQAAYTIGLRIEMLAVMIAFPIANACATLVGQNLGAGDLPRAWRAVRTTCAVEAVALWPAALLLFVFRADLVAFFTDDAAVAKMASDYLLFSSIILLFNGFYFVAFRSLQAAGDMNSPMVISLATAFVLGGPIGFVLAGQTDLGAMGMWIANFVYAVVNAALMIGWLLVRVRKVRERRGLPLS